MNLEVVDIDVAFEMDYFYTYFRRIDVSCMKKEELHV